MAGPWERFQQPVKPESEGPWARFAQPVPLAEQPAPAPEPDLTQQDAPPTALERAGGYAMDLIGIGPQRAMKGLADTAAVLNPLTASDLALSFLSPDIAESVRPFNLPRRGAEAVSDFFNDGIEAGEGLRSDAYNQSRKQGFVETDENGEITGLKAPSVDAVAGTILESGAQIPFMLSAGSGLTGLARQGITSLAPKLAPQAAKLLAPLLGYGAAGAGTVAPTEADQVARDVYEKTLSSKLAGASFNGVQVTPEFIEQAEQEATTAAEQARAKALAMLIPLTAATGAAGQGLGAYFGGNAKNLLAAMLKGGAIDAPSEFVEEAGTSAISDIAKGEKVNKAAALDAGLLGTAAGSFQGAATAGYENVRARGEAAATPPPIPGVAPAPAAPSATAQPAPAAQTARPAQPVPEADEAAANDIMAALQAAGVVPPVVPEQGASPEPVAPAAGSQPVAAVSPNLGEQFAEAAPSMPAQSPSAPLAERLQGDGAVTGPAPSAPGTSAQQARPPLSVRMGDQEFAVDSYEDASSKFLEIKARGDIGGMKAIELIDQNGTPVGFIGQSGEVYDVPLSSLKANPNTLPAYRPQAQSDRAPIDGEATRIAGDLSADAPLGEQFANAAPPAGDLTLQNRDRSRAASVAQMQAIRKAPDAERLSFSRDPNTGAPMVGEGRQIPATDRGRTDTVIMASGRRVPVTYAVVEADDLAASHDADGKVNPGYESAPLRALNNGRVAGLQAAHAAGNTAGYIDGIVADAAVHGVPESAIRSKRKPVLVRLYDPAVNTGDMGAESNASAQLGLSPVEQAQTDARALPDMSGLQWAEDGNLSPGANSAFYRAWFAALGDTASASLQDANGRPNAAAVLRIRSAMAQRAYGDDALLTALAEEVNPDNRNVLNAMVQAAPAFAALEEGGALTTDVRATLSAAFSLLRDAAGRGTSVADLIAQSDIFGRNPAADAVALFMAENARSAKRMAEAFKAMAAYVDARQRSEAVVDMFGTAETPSILGAIEAANAALKEAYGQQFQIDTSRLDRSARSEPSESRSGSGERDAGRGAATDQGDTARARDGATGEDTSPALQKREALNESGIPAGLPAVSTDAAGKLAKRLSDDRKRQGLTGKFRFQEILPASLPEPLRRALSALEQATGTRVVVVRNLTPELDTFNGVNFRDGILYVDENADRLLTLVSTHEWVHQLKRDQPPLYQRLEDEVRRQGNIPAWIERMRAERNSTEVDVAIEELTADAVADAMLDPDFLRRVVEEGGTLRRAARSFLQFLDNMLARLKGRNTAAYLADVQAFRDELAAVLREYQNRETQPDASREVPDDTAPSFMRGSRASTDTAEFRNWFRKSAVTTDQGAPLSVYHGTGDEFDAFDAGRLASATDHASAGLGFFFTPDRAGAKSYADKASNYVPADAVVLEVYLSIQKPYEMSLDEAQAFDTPADASKRRKQLEAQGYDGIHIPEQNAWVAFKPSQVKRTDNLGAWNPNDDRMMYQRRGAASGDLFGEPTTRERVQAEQEARDAKRDGRTSTGRTDMMAGDGDLFAGPRPEQAGIEDGSLEAEARSIGTRVALDALAEYQRGAIDADNFRMLLDSARETQAARASRTRPPEPTGDAYSDTKRKWDYLLSTLGRQRAMQRASDTAAGNVIGREFGESAEAFYARTPAARALRDWIAEQGGRPMYQRRLTGDVFESAALRAIEEGKGAPKRSDAAGWKGWLDGAVRRGDMKQAERDWLDIDGWLERVSSAEKSRDGRQSFQFFKDGELIGQGDERAAERRRESSPEIEIRPFAQKSQGITREALADYVRANQVELEETRLSNIDGGSFTVSDELNLWMGENEVDPPESSADWQSLALDLRDEGLEELADEAEKIGDAAYDGGSDGATKFSDYQLPGGQNYREVLLTLPAKSFIPAEETEVTDRLVAKYGRLEPDDWTEQERADWYAEARRNDSAMDNAISPTIKENFKSAHWDQPNVLAHMRLNDRTDAQGREVLFIEEIQSDWHQAGRKSGYRDGTDDRIATSAIRRDGYWEVLDQFGNFASNVQDYANRDGGELGALAVAQERMAMSPGRASRDLRVPNAPLKSSDEWAMLAFKRAVREAVDAGKSVIAWTTGEQQAERYKLSNTVQFIDVYKDQAGRNAGIKFVQGGRLRLTISDDGVVKGVSSEQRFESLIGKPLDDVVGKDMAKRIMDAEHGQTFSGDGLNVGGQGMRGFYDKILPSAVSKWAKKFGGRVTQTSIATSERNPFNLRVASDGKEYWVEGENPQGNIGNSQVLSPRFGSAAEAMDARDAIKSGMVKQHALEITPAMREAASGAMPLFQRRSADPAKQKGVLPKGEWEEGLRRFVGGAAMVTSAEAMSYDFRSGKPVVVEAMHGTKRPDRIGRGFSAKRATSGPMAYFTSAPDVASNYAQNKNDTSLAYEDGDYGNWFKVNVPGSRAPVSIDRAWFSLSSDERQRMTQLAGRVMMDDESMNVVLGDEGETNGNGSFAWELKQARGNVLKALVESWLTSGAMYNEEQQFNDVLRVAGFPMDRVTYDPPNAEYPAVMPVFIKMRSPLVTNDIPSNVVDALESAAKRDRSKAGLGSDAWDKNTTTLREWVRELSGSRSEYVWTTIPDKVTDVFRSLGYDGIIDVGGKNGGSRHKVYIPFGEGQVKGRFNRGTFDETKPKDILMQRRSVPQAQAEAARARATVNSSLGNPMAGGALGWNPVKGEWEGSRKTLRKWREAAQDKYISLRDLQEDIEAATGMELPDAQNVYRIENLMHGRVQDGILNIERKHLDPLFVAMRKAGVDAKTLEAYLYARHAEERNNHIATINAAMPDGGSGMSTADARAALRAADTAKLEPLAERVDALMADTRKRLLDSGVITREQYDAMESQYQHYVPLRGRDESEAMEVADRGGGMGRGIEQRSSGIKRAAGRKSLAVNLLGEAMADAQRAVIAAEKARVGRAVARLVLANPNPNLWEIEAVRTERKFDAQGNVYEAVINESAEPDVVHVLIQGKPYRVRIVNRHVIQALKNLGANELHNFLRPLAWMNRYVSATLTSYNPGFIAVNLTRDAVFGTTRILAEDGIATYASTVAGYGPAMKAITLNEANAAGSNPMDARLREFLSAGGKTGWVSMNAVEDLQKGIWIDASGKLTATGVRGVRAIVRFVESANVVVENAMRLAYFSALRDRGLSIEKAAERAKNLTLNFNRKGRFANLFSAGYLFFNPAIQGTHVLGKLAKNPKALGMVGTMAAAQAVLAMLAAGIEDEDGETLASKVPEYIKERNLWAVIPGERGPTGKLLKGEKDRIVTLPMPFGFNVLTYSASVGVDVFTKDMPEIAAGAKSPVGVAASVVGRLTNAFVGATAPVPLNDGIGGILPSIPVQIGLGILTGKDSLDRQIRQPQFDLNNPEPLAYNPRPETPQAFVQMAQGLNWLGGGDEFRRPVTGLDWAPEDFEYMWGWVVGGAGRFLTDTATGTYNFFEDPEANENKGAPIAKAFTQPLNDQGAVLGAYYQRAEAIEEQERRIRTIATRDGIDAAIEHADSVPFMAGVVIREKSNDDIEIKPGSSDVYDAYRRAQSRLRALRAEERLVYEEQGRGIINVERAKLLREIRAQRVEAVKDVNLYWNEAVRPLTE